MKTTLVMSLLCIGSLAMSQTILSSGHIDLGLAYPGGVWEPHVHAHDGDLEFAPDEALLYYGTNARFARPAGSAYDVLGVAAGAQIWRNFSGNVPDIPWLGFGFEEITAGTFGSYLQTDDRRDPIVAEWIDVSLVGYTAPAGGHVTFFQGQGSSPTIWFATSDGISASDKFISTVAGHEHGSFAFTKAGLYSLTFVASAIDVSTGNRITSDEYTYHFGVEAVPEPGTLSALVAGLALAFRRKKR